MNTAVKIAIALVGGYFLIKQTGITIPGFADTTPNNRFDKPADKPADPPPGSTNTITPAEKEAIIRRAAKGDQAAVAQAKGLGVKLNSDQWNFYRQQETGEVTTTDLFPEGNRAALMDAAEYISRRQGAGLGFVGRSRF